MSASVLFTMKKALSIKEAAADPFGIKIAQNAFAFQLNQLFERLNFLNGQIEQLDAEIIKYYETFECYLHTIPGVGIIAAATILGEIGDIRRFKNNSIPPTIICPNVVHHTCDTPSSLPQPPVPSMTVLCMLTIKRNVTRENTT